MLEDLDKLRRQQIIRICMLVVLDSLLAGVFIWLWPKIIGEQHTTLVIALDCLTIAIIGAITTVFTIKMMFRPARVLTQAILHVASEHSNIPAPDLTKIHIGKKALTELVGKIYDMASSSNTLKGADATSIQQLRDLSDKLPMPVIIFDSQDNIVFVDQMAEDYVGLHASQMVGAVFWDIFKLSFSSDLTLDAWVKECRTNKAVDHAMWQRVRLPDSKNPAVFKQFDLAAYFNKDNPFGNEVIVSLFDRTDSYARDDLDLSFVALAVHELRTPITIMRGYIEVFEDELMDKLDDDHKRFMRNLKVSAESLGGFINNILNVARIENNQLELHLTETTWPEVVNQAIVDMNLKAAITNVHIEAKLALDLPHVGVDRVSIYEVLTNLLDNAIKYSPAGSVITVSSAVNDTFVETTVTDTGIGIPDSLMPHLFDKFYRSHRSRSQVGGTGLGLYLCKKIVKAHDGELWVKSKENQGSTFGFKIHTWDSLAAERKEGDNGNISRGAHGWIKNHSLYRG